ncbi:hypothetical protein ACTMU2_12445 [Cupriavidus basilensis]
MAPDIPLDNQRPADYVFSRHVEIKLEEIGRAQPQGTPGQGGEHRGPLTPMPAEAAAMAATPLGSALTCVSAAMPWPPPH